MTALRLGVNVDHVATIRTRAGASRPGPRRHNRHRGRADGITARLHEDRATSTRRHAPPQGYRLETAQFRNRRRPRRSSTSRCASPRACCLVPESARSKTTKDGLDVVNGFRALEPFVADSPAAENPRLDVHRAVGETLKDRAISALRRRTARRRLVDALAHGNSSRADYQFGRLRIAAAGPRRCGSMPRRTRARLRLRRARLRRCRRS